MRVIAGRFRGRRLKSPKGDTTRPTSDRVRESLFSALSSMLGPDLGGTAVLDAFAGSGALGIEALSRGSARVTFIESNRAAQAALRDNIALIGAEDVTRVLSGDAFTLARQAVAGGPFSLILLDPPYTLDQTKVAQLLETLVQAGALAEDAVVTWEHAKGIQLPWPAGFVVQQRRT